MKTLVEIVELENDNFVFRWIDDYPVEVEGKLSFPVLLKKDPLENKIFKKQENDVIECKIIEKIVFVPPEESIKFKKSAEWKQVILDDGFIMILPPETPFVRNLLGES